MRLACSLALFATAASAAAQDAAPQPQSAGGGDREEGRSKPDLAPSPSLDFELLPEAKTPVVPSARLEREVQRRRRLLTVHQGLGIATWGAVAATAIVGQLDFDDRFRGGGDTRRFHPWHKGLAYGSAALFATTGSLALLAPNPYPKKLRLDTATIHKSSMAIATAGMIAQIILGPLARSKAGSLRERDLAAVHQVVGYATFGAMTVGAGALLFP